jgi:hypothetical protein
VSPTQLCYFCRSAPGSTSDTRFGNRGAAIKPATRTFLGPARFTTPPNRLGPSRPVTSAIFDPSGDHLGRKVLDRHQWHDV